LIWQQTHRLDPAERQRQLGFLNAGLTSDLRARLEPDLITTGVRDRRGRFEVYQLC